MYCSFPSVFVQFFYAIHPKLFAERPGSDDVTAPDGIIVPRWVCNDPHMRAVMDEAVDQTETMVSALNWDAVAHLAQQGRITGLCFPMGQVRMKQQVSPCGHRETACF